MKLKKSKPQPASDWDFEEEEEAGGWDLDGVEQEMKNKAYAARLKENAKKWAVAKAGWEKEARGASNEQLEAYWEALREISDEACGGNYTVRVDVVEAELKKRGVDYRKRIKPDPEKITDYGELIMEVIESRGAHYHEQDDSEWSSFFHTMGRHNAKTLARDMDRWYKFIYAAELLRRNGTFDMQVRDGYMPNEKVPETDVHVLPGGKAYGDGFYEEEAAAPEVAAAPVVEELTVREQVELKREENIELKTEGVKAAEVTDEQGQPEKERWDEAIKVASTNDIRKFEGYYTATFEKMVKYCYKHLRDLQDVPWYPSVVDLFWTVDHRREETQEQQDRRTAIVERVMSFWAKNVAKDHIGFNASSTSYRTVLTAMALDRAIEVYVKAEGTDLQAYELTVREAATKYFQSHFPLEGERGPSQSVDPDYAEYIRLCQTYDIVVGSYLNN